MIPQSSFVIIVFLFSGHEPGGDLGTLPLRNFLLPVTLHAYIPTPVTSPVASFNVAQPLQPVRRSTRIANRATVQPHLPHHRTPLYLWLRCVIRRELFLLHA